MAHTKKNYGGASFWGPAILLVLIVTGSAFLNSKLDTMDEKNLIKPIHEQTIAITPAQENLAHATDASSIQNVSSTQLHILNEILDSRDDNDPRLDRDLRILSPSSKILFKEKYHRLAAEKLNEKGTIVFLLGRNLQDKNDFTFFNDVLSEAPCYSLADCKSKSRSDESDAIAENGNEVTLSYPQIVALKALDSYLTSERPVLAPAALKNIQTAAHSENLLVRRKAQELLTKFQITP